MTVNSESEPSQVAGRRLRVLVVDDHPIWRDGVARDLTERGFDVPATVGDGSAALAAALSLRPDVVLMDLNLESGSGVRATQEITSRLGATRVLALSASGEQDDVLQALKAGASGYLVKSASVEQLVDAVRRTADGDAVFTPGIAGLVLGEYRRIADGEGGVAPQLTDRETDVLRLVAMGLSSRQIATRLALSPRTVDNYVHSTLRKLQLHNRVELTRYAIRHGFDERAASSEQP